MSVLIIWQVIVEADTGRRKYYGASEQIDSAAAAAEDEKACWC